MSDVKTLSTTVTVAKGTTVAVAQIWGAAIDGLKEEGKVPQNCLPWAEINVEKTEADKPKKGHEGDRVYHVDVHYRELQPGETVTTDEVVASLLAPPTFDPNEPQDEHA